jgi:mannitol/fructose-specific phosphotransferase system IIA component (Ntr-type)
MKICGLLTENHIFFDFKNESKRALLEEFVNALKTRGIIKNEKLVLEELFAREDLCSTGLEKGIAVPHALTSEIEGSFLALAVIRNGVDFGSVDQMPTYILLMLLVF